MASDQPDSTACTYTVPDGDSFRQCGEPAEGEYCAAHTWATRNVTERDPCPMCGDRHGESETCTQDYQRSLSTSDLLEKYRRTVAEPLPLLTDYSPQGQIVAFAAYQQAVIELMARLDAAESELLRLTSTPTSNASPERFDEMVEAAAKGLFGYWTIGTFSIPHFAMAPSWDQLDGAGRTFWRNLAKSALTAAGVPALLGSNAHRDLGEALPGGPQSRQLEGQRLYGGAIRGGVGRGIPVPAVLHCRRSEGNRR